MMTMMTDAGGDAASRCAARRASRRCARTLRPRATPAAPPARRGAIAGAATSSTARPRACRRARSSSATSARPAPRTTARPGSSACSRLCGNGLARCYRHCTTNDQCDGTACTIAIDDGKRRPRRRSRPATSRRAPAIRSRRQLGLSQPGAQLLPHEREPDAVRLPDEPAGAEQRARARSTATAPRASSASRASTDSDAALPLRVQRRDAELPHGRVSRRRRARPAACVPAGTGAKYGYCEV